MTSISSLSQGDLTRFIAVLETRVQGAIARTAPPLVTGVQGRIQQGRLLVLAETEQAILAVNQRNRQFVQLAQAVRTGLAETELPEGLLTEAGVLPVRLYLRKRGEASPYAARNWHWQPADALADLFNETPTPEEKEAAALRDSAGGAIVLLPSHPDVANPDTAPALEPSYAELLPSPWQRFLQGTSDWPWRSLTVLMVSGVVLGSVAYGLSRPCLIGSCARRQTASDLSQEALNQLEQRPTATDIETAYGDLVKAVHLLSAIPPWSPHYNTVQADLARYRAQLGDLQWIREAQKSAIAAANKSQNPPHPVPRWVEIHLLWQRAVNDLKRVPDNSPLAPLAQEKLTEYAANHAAIGQRVQAEEAAEASLNAALQAGQLATARLETAENLNGWQLALQAWTEAVNALRRIPQGTMAYTEAQPLLTDYRQSLVETRTQVNREKAGDRVYQEALTEANLAREAERNNQWTTGVRQWQRAIAQIRQVPNGTSLYPEAQGLLNTYEGALQQARSNLRQAVALQTIDTDLDALCPPQESLCFTTITYQRIQVTLLAPYDRAVSQSISPPANQGTPTQPSTVVNQTHELVQSIMQLGNRVQMPIELYGPEGSFIARYVPEHGGFVKQ